MQNNFYGYIKVFSKQQNEDKQRITPLDFGVPQENIYMDKQSGSNFERPQYQNLLKRIKQGDTLIVKRYGLKAIFTSCIIQLRSQVSTVRRNLYCVKQPFSFTYLYCTKGYSKD